MIRQINNILRLIWNILLVYVAYGICRATFMICNSNMYQGIETSHIFDLFKAGLIFDSSAICYTNAIVMLLFLLPLHWKETRGFYTFVKWLYVVINSICISMNLCDLVYFPFTSKRVTFSVLQEFENEGAGQMGNIFFDQALSHWYLFIVFFALVAMLWYGFAYPVFEQKSRQIVRTGDIQKNNHIGYYSVNAIALPLFVGLSTGLIRGGFTTAVRPITISNANKYADNPQEAGAILNTPFSLIRTFDKKPLTLPDYMSKEEALQYYSPIHNASPISNIFSQNEDREKPLNVVVLILESFGKQHFGFYNDLHNENGEDGIKKSFTPFLDSLLTDSYTFRYSYSNGRKSIEGMPSVLSSIPNFVEPFFLTPAAMNELSGLARELTVNKGYTSAFFHGAENGSMGFEAFAKSTGFQKYYGRTEYDQDPNYRGEKDFDGTWAIYDEEFLQFYCDRINEMQQPFITSVFTASSHTPYNLPERYKGHFPVGEDKLQECVAYSDNALRLFFEKAKAQEWYNNTLFVITPDHASGFYDSFYNTTLGIFSVPIIFFSPKLTTLKGYDEETIAEQIDIMPTVLGLLGYDKPFFAFGQDLFNTPKDEKFAIHWLPGSEEYEFLNKDLLLVFDGSEVKHIYKFKTDPLLKTDLVGTIPTDSISPYKKRMESVIQQYMQHTLDNTMVIK